MPNGENNDIQNETWTNIDTRKGIGIKRARKAPNTKKTIMYKKGAREKFKE